MTEATTTARSANAGAIEKTVAVIGATGAVGAEMLRCLVESSIKTGELKAFASERSAGKRFKFRGKEVEMQVLTDDAFKGVDVALFASETDISKKYVPIAVESGAIAIDNSSAFRMDYSVPLVVPEVNGDLIKPSQKIYANPNCVAAIMVMALAKTASQTMSRPAGYQSRAGVPSGCGGASPAGCARRQRCPSHTAGMPTVTRKAMKY